MVNTLSFFLSCRTWIGQWRERYALACAYFLRCVDSIARSRSAVVWDSLSRPGTGRKLERSQNAPETESWRRDSRWQEEVTYFIGLQMRVLWWWVWVSGWHRQPSPTPQFHRYTLCRSHELQVHVIDPTRRFLHGKSSPTWHPRCVHVVLPHHVQTLFCHFATRTLSHQNSCNNVYKVNNVNNSVIMVHNGKQRVHFLSENPWQKIYYDMISNIIHIRPVCNNSVIRGALS